MAQVLYHGYSPSFTMAGSSSSLPAFRIANTDTLHALQLKKYRIGMGGTGSASVTFQIFCESTGGTTAGTSTALTGISQVGGRVLAAGGIAVSGCNYTGAPASAVFQIVDEITLVNNQTIVYDYPWGDEPDCVLGTATGGAGVGMLITSGTPVATTIDMWVSRI
jgi:hypothetical protein